MKNYTLHKKSFFFAKRPKRNILVLCLLLLLGVFTTDALAQRKEKKRKKKNKSEVIQKEPIDGEVGDNIKAEQAFVEGMREFIKEEFRRAIPHFEESLKYDSKNATAHYQIALCHYRLNELEKALMYAMEASKVEEKNFYFLSTLANIQRDMQMLDAAEQTYKQILSKVGKDDVTYLNLASIYIEMNEYKKAIQVYDEMEKELGMNQNVIRQKQILYLQMQNEDAALKEGEKLIEEYPEVLDFRLSQIELLINQKRYPDAERLLQGIVEEEKNLPPKLYLMFAQVYHYQDKQEQEVNYLKKAFLSEEMSIEAKLSFLMNLYKKANARTEKGQETLQICIELAQTLTKTHPKAASSHGALGDFLLQEKKYNEAFESYRKALALEPNNYSLWERTTQLALESKKYQYAIQTSEDALEYFPNQPNLWFLNGVAYLSDTKNERAIASLEQGKRLVFNNPELLSQFESQLGDIYNQNEQYEKADKAYENALEKNPNNAHALNNYAYYLSLREEKLDRAEELGKRLVKLYPENPTYLDTYGWVLYVKKKYKEAEKYLALAAQNSKSAVVVEHYGDVLLKLGKKAEALEQWQRAFSLDSTNVELQEKIQKLRSE